MPGGASNEELTETSAQFDVLQGDGQFGQFRKYAMSVLGAAVFVIIFGAFVRASYSGDGCGASWPLCEGQLIPEGTRAATLIEFTHRATSGILLLMVIGLYMWARKAFESASPVRKAAFWSLIFTLSEALVGMLLVRFSWVVEDKSIERAIVMPLHLVNTYALLVFLTAAAAPAKLLQQVKMKSQGPVLWALVFTAFGSLVMAGTGALSALGKTAFAEDFAAAENLSARWSMHLGEGAHPLLKGGLAHPLLASSIFLFIVVAAAYVASRRPDPQIKKWARWTMIGFAGQMAIGVLNVLISAPVWMQLVHLGAAVAIWLSLVILSICVLATRPKEVELNEMSANEPEEPKEKPSFGQLVKDYIALTKPRVISLLLFTTVLAMYLPEGQWPHWTMVLWVTIGGYMAAGAANTFNMVIERDLDLAMERTASRPTVDQRISVKHALIFGVILAVGSFAVLTLAANVLAALLAWAGLAFYVLIYTLVLKRRTWQNIVIGGAAGSFPPLVGYAAVAGELNLYAWMLFALVFMWTPVHFWALAILIKEDYAKAGVPMLPVVKGERATVVQITIYAFLTALVSVIPLFQQAVGMVYIIGAGVLNLILVAQSIQLMRHTDKPRARALFKYSMAYLALMFIVLAIDRGMMQ